MALNVLYEGITLAEGVEVRPGEDGLFLPLAAPMPVGTRLHVERAGQGRQRVRVRRVVEGEASGVFISAEGAQLFPLVEAAAVATSTAVSGPIAIQVPRPVEPEVTVPTPPRVVEPEVTVPVEAPPLLDEAAFDDNDLPGDRTIIMSLPPVAPTAAADEESDGDPDPGPEEAAGAAGEATPSTKGTNGAARKGRGKGKRSGGKR